jgi:type 1 glutamine amidotransferase
MISTLTRNRRSFLVFTTAVLAACCLPLHAVQAETPLQQVPDDQIQKIKDALPDKPTVEPAEPRKVLVFYRCEGFVHGSIACINKTLEMMGKKSGAFETVVSEDMSMFDPDKLNQFDAVVFNNTTRLKFADPKHREALMDFVKGGKGIVGIHGASDNFYEWPEAAAMMGGLFAGHPWNAGGTWAVQLDEPDHPLNKAFGGKGFFIRDEIYKVEGPYSRDNLRVLVGLDMTKKRNQLSGGRADNDHAISWIRDFGDGRVFYCSLGHNNDVFWNPAVLQHYLDGIQYAVGDLKADATPSAKLDPKPTPALCPEE